MSSIPKLLSAVGGLAVAGVIVVGTTGLVAERSVARGIQRTEEAGRALRQVTLADMSHDGLRAEVYGYILSTTPEGRAEARSGVESHSEVLLALAKDPDLAKLGKSRATIEATTAAVEEYVREGRRIVSETPSPKVDLAPLDASFRALEKDLETPVKQSKRRLPR